MSHAPLFQPEWTVSTPTFASDELHPLMRVYPWAGHRGFAYDLVRFMRPSRLVELGVHWGTSYFAFLQAMRDEKIDGECVGVDTWRGDGHTGPYGEDVYRNVTDTIAKFFTRQRTRLLRMTFDEALPHVDDASAELIHIDGFHTYDAVAHDFETWLPKLAENGVMLFHDTADDTGYGSAKFWDELSKKHTSFAFTHSWGLGVLFPKGDAVYRRLVAQNIGDKVGVYEFRSRYELASIERDDNKKMAVERMVAIDNQSRMISERDATIAKLQAEANGARKGGEQIASEQRDARATIEKLAQDLKSASELAVERMGAINHQSEMIARRDAEIQKFRARETELTERARAMAQEGEARKAAEGELRKRVDEIHRALTSLATMRAEHETVRAQLAEAQREREAILGEVRSLAMAAKAQSEENQRLRARAAELDQHAAELVATLRQREAELQSERGEHERVRGVSAALTRDLDASRNELAAREREHRDRLKVIESLRRTIEEKNDMIEELRALTGKLNTDIELLELRTERLEQIIQMAAKDRGGPWARALAALRGNDAENGLATAVKASAESHRKA
ncbi:MAG: class I SAM-dependent methyltransferase [Phycisphaerales bacterium]